MPIAAQCGSCAARYKIVDTASGRRVRCRRCGKPFMVPGAAPTERGPDLRAMADLERKGQVLTASAESEFENYQATIATLTQTTQSEKDAAAAKRKSHGRSVMEVATPDYLKRNDIAESAEKQGNPYIRLGVGVGVICIIGLVLWIEGPKIWSSATGYVSKPSPPPPGHLNTFGEVDGAGRVVANPLFPNTNVYLRPQAKLERVLYFINLGTDVDGTLHPPTGFKTDLDKLLKDRCKTNGLIEFDQAHLAAFLHINDVGARGQMFTKKDDEYVPDDNDKITAMVPFLRCTFALDGDEGRLLHEEKKDMREIKIPIKADTPQELQKAIDAYQWNGAMEFFKGLHLPDKPMWTEYDQGHNEMNMKWVASTRAAQTQRSSSPAPNAKATGQ